MKDILGLLTAAKVNTSHSRDIFIEHHREFIRGYCSMVCKRPLSWANDDELSIALIAFNEAIDSFKGSDMSHFRGFARLVMKRRLTDYFRKEQKNSKVIPFSGDEESPMPEEYRISYDSFLKTIEISDKSYEIEHLNSRLKEYGLSFDKLADNSPRHRKTRESLKKLAQDISSKKDLMEKILKERQLPMQGIVNSFGASRKVIETWRRYLIALVILLTDGELPVLKEYVFGKGNLNG
jgi:RNA polymerase sigma factor